MPVQKADIPTVIEETINANSTLRELWENSRMEYAVYGDLIKSRKEKELVPR